jgi:hypothetical protein
MFVVAGNICRKSLKQLGFKQKDSKQLSQKDMGSKQMSLRKSDFFFNVV